MSFKVYFADSLKSETYCVVESEWEAEDICHMLNHDPTHISKFGKMNYTYSSEAPMYVPSYRAEREAVEVKKGKLFVLFGLSGSGKDTVAALMGEENVKWSGLMKRTFEKWYDLSEGDFDDRELRVQNVPGEDFSYLEVMMRACEAWDTIDQKLTIRPTVRRICKLLDEGYDVVLTDTRKMLEADAVCKLSEQGYDVISIYIYGRVGETRQRTDALLEGLRTKVEESNIYSRFTIRNTMGIDELKEQVDTIKRSLDMNLDNY